MILKTGALFSCHYNNWHNDKTPLLFILYSDSTYTVGLNAHYLTKKDFEKLTNLIAKIKLNTKMKLQFIRSPRNFYYNILKPKFKSIIDDSYRTYHTKFLIGIPAHPAIYMQIGSKWKKYKGIKYRKEIKQNNLRSFGNQLKLSIESEKKSLRRIYGRK